MKKLENILLVINDSLQRSMIKSILSSVKIYDYEDLEELSEYMVSDLSPDLILLDDCNFLKEMSKGFISEKSKIVLLSENQNKDYHWIKLPVQAINFKEELDKFYK